MVKLKLEKINEQQIIEACAEVVRISKDYKWKNQFVGLNIYGDIEWYQNASAMYGFAMPLVKYTTTKKVISAEYCRFVQMDSILMSKFIKAIDKALANSST